MSSDHDDRTEQPTARRRQQLRERGLVARSSDLTTAVVLLAAAATLNYFGKDLTITLAELLKKSLSTPAWTTLDVKSASSLLNGLALVTARSVAPILALIFVSAIAVNALQVGFLFTGAPLTPDISRFHPGAGFGRMFSLQGATRLLGGLLKLAVIVALSVGFVAGELPRILGTLNLGPAPLCRQTGAALVGLGFQLSIGLVALAILDYGFQVWKFERDHRMTKQEIREELREAEGDPQLRQRRRAARPMWRGRTQGNDAI
jgi:flagellar biosynthetic protein FlhB